MTRAFGRAWVAVAFLVAATQTGSLAGSDALPCGHLEHALSEPWFHTGDPSGPLPAVFRVEPLFPPAVESLPRASSGEVVRPVRLGILILPSLDNVRAVEGWNFEALMVPRDETPYEVWLIEPRESREPRESLSMEGRERRELNAYGLSTDLWERLAMDEIAGAVGACDR